jgi:excinuclease UvrABC nuclease subunit
VDFPQVDITERQRLPVFCAVYLAVKGRDTVLYVGATQNLRERWKSHHCWKRLRAAGATHIAWLPQEDIQIGREIERHCIHRYDPPFNYLDNSYYTGGTETVKLTRDDRALVAAFAAQLSQSDAYRDYGTADALRIAALRYLRGALFPPQEKQEDGI